jgi:hypothetical protein
VSNQTIESRQRKKAPRITVRRGSRGFSRPCQRDAAPADDVAAAIQRFEDRLQKARPDVKYICV